MCIKLKLINYDAELHLFDRISLSLSFNCLKCLKIIIEEKKNPIYRH